MSTIADIAPDIVLAKLLDNKIKVQTSATQSHTIRTYDDESRPNKGVGDEWVDVEWNGVARSLTDDPALFRISRLCRRLHRSSTSQSQADMRSDSTPHR